MSRHLSSKDLELEKLKPTYILKDVKELIRKGKVIPNLQLIESANALGFSETEIYDAVSQLEWNDFCKSMTENFNHKVWQDVYKKSIKDKPMYIKFQIVEDQFLLRSFKIDEQL